MVDLCNLAMSTYHTRSRGPPPPSRIKGKGKGEMDNLSGNKKDNTHLVENVETSDGRNAPGEK